MIRTPLPGPAAHGAAGRLHARFARGFAAVAALACVGGMLALASPAGAQFGGGAGVPSDPTTLVGITAPALQVKAGSRAEAEVRLAIEKTWHINANPPSPDYMIPTAVEFTPPRGIAVGAVKYPPPKPLQVEFDDSALFVYDGEVVVRVPLTVSVMTPGGTYAMEGTLRFQACNDEVCLAPVTVPFTLEVAVEGTQAAPRDPTPEAGRAPPGEVGAPPGDTRETPVEDGFESVPPVDGGAPAGDAPGALRSHAGRNATQSALLDNPLARKLDSGSWTAFITLFLIGLALNLTPCVYPMLGVTVSIFGARRSARPLQAAGYAVIYVLGMALMYSVLGLVAAFTGGLFGGFLQSPIVLVVIGMLLVGLSLSMFGLYEIQLPASLTTRLGGTTATSAAGVFLSGLVVGVFAAPCIGPPIVALLALVGAKGDPVFGFTSFFTLAMGLGAPYLVLGTFSNLLQRLPRSGDWMVWVKKVFGIVLVAIGAFYVSLAVAPGLGAWITPLALVVGGVFLGFFERSGEKRPGFRWIKRLSGGAAAIAGAVLVVTAPSEGVVFEDFTHEALQAALASGTPVMVDFTADWCVPCHELERFTFTDGRVRSAARGFRTFRVDLTRYDSPEAERYRRDYRITGVPTVLFLAPDGSEIIAARVEGFIPPEPFLARMRHVQQVFATAANTP